MSHKYKIDIWILVPVLLLMVFSIGAVYSASSTFAFEKYQDSNYLFKQHGIKVILSVITIFIFAKIDYRTFENFSKALIWITIILLVFTLFSSKGPIKGASRWINLGPLSFQPSELARYTIVLYVSALLARKKDYMDLLYRGYLPVIFYVLLITGLILIQPNFSVSMIIFSTCMFMIFLSEAKLKHILFTLLALTPIAAIFVLSKDYIVGRLTSFADYQVSGNTSYQLQQALIGFGNGGLLGIGPGGSNQRDFYLPEAHGDFIFSIIGEEYGFIGTFIILSLYFVILVRGYKIAKESSDDFGKYLAFGIITLISLNALVNMSVASGVIPTTGVTLPFVSYGGTSILFTSVATGILLNISSQRDETDQGLVIE
jgi:cell division protein FtsW